MYIGQHAIKKFGHWTTECKWNFENNLLLLKAEHNFAIGELEAAKEYYQLYQGMPRSTTPEEEKTKLVEADNSSMSTDLSSDYVQQPSIIATASNEPCDAIDTLDETPPDRPQHVMHMVSSRTTNN